MSDFGYAILGLVLLDIVVVLMFGRSRFLVHRRRLMAGARLTLRASPRRDLDEGGTHVQDNRAGA